MRAIWTGAISFGLVNIPVKLFSASGSQSLDFDMLRKSDHSRIKYKRVAASDGEEVDYNDIVKGYEYEKDHYVVLDKEDFEKASPDKTNAINILNFVKEEEIDPIYYEKPYYLEPTKTAAKPYALLREALNKSKKVGIANYVLRNREHLAVIKPIGDVILLNQIRYEHEVRKPDELNLPGNKEVTDKEVKMALSLVDQLSEDFNPSQYQDTYMDELMTIIEAKAKGRTVESAGEKPKSTPAPDLFETLKASLNASKEKKPESRPAAKKPASAKSKSKKKSS